MQESFLCSLIPQKKDNIKYRNKNMEKKTYIEPSMIVKKVNLVLMAGSLNDEVGAGDNFSKGVELPEEDNDVTGSHDVWED